MTIRLVDSEHQRWRSRIKKYTKGYTGSAVSYRTVIERREWIVVFGDLIPWLGWVPQIEYTINGSHLPADYSPEEVKAAIKTFVAKEEAAANLDHKMGRIKPDYWDVEVSRYMPTSSHIEVAHE